MAKGLDQKFLHYGIRKEDLIESLCEKHHIDFDWLSEDILRLYHAAKVDKIGNSPDKMKYWTQSLSHILPR